MTANHEFERRLGDWLRDDSENRVPDHITQVLVRTVATRQRPWWSSPRRWLPIDLPDSRLWAGRPTSLRTVLVLAIVALVAGALIALVVGSQRHLPPPFGPARNGAVVVSQEGDLFSVDPKTGRATPLITDPIFDFGPLFSRDGTRFVFFRRSDPIISSAGLELMVANADGSGIRALVHRVPELNWVNWSPDSTWVDWSPNSTRVAFLSRPPGTAGPRINIVDVDGTGLTSLNTQPANQISWLPPDGAEILFRGDHILDRDPPLGIWAVRPDGQGLRRVSTRPALDRNDYNDLTVSPDGNLVAYRYVGGPTTPFEIHFLDIRTGRDWALPQPSGSAGAGGPSFSPDGSSIVYLHWFDDASTQLVVAPVDGSDFGIPIGPHGPLGPDGPTINYYGFVPDGTAVFASYHAEKLARILPIDGSPGIDVARGELAFPAYQRLAP